MIPTIQQDKFDNAYFTWREAAELAGMTNQDFREMAHSLRISTDPVSKSSPRCILMRDITRIIEHINR